MLTAGHRLHLLYRGAADIADTVLSAADGEREQKELELVVKHPDLPKHSPRRIQNTNPSLVLKPPLSRLHSSRQPKLCTYSSEVSDHHRTSEWVAVLGVLLSVISSFIIGHLFPVFPS